MPADLSLTGLVDERVKQLAEETQTTVYLSVVKGDMVECKARHNGGRAIEVRWWNVGELRHFNIGTGPRILLAFQEPGRRAYLIDAVLKLDQGEADALRTELEEIRSRGVIVKHDEIAPGLSAMAVPLLDQNGRILAAISTGGLTPRYTGAQRAEIGQLMAKAATEMREMIRGFPA